MVRLILEKSELRTTMLDKLKNMEKRDKERRNELIREKLFSLPEYKNSNLIMSYVSLDYEVDTWQIIKKSLETGKKVAVPVVMKEEMALVPSLIVDPAELKPGPYGVFQPDKKNMRALELYQIDIIIVPGIAFDYQGNRLGHGRGYFDRFLKKVPLDIPRIGLAYGIQILDHLPISCLDVPVSKLIYA
jgi:5-formyltetrahydrofolate cyclo-ligase